MDLEFWMLRITACFGAIVCFAGCRGGDEIEWPAHYEDGGWQEFEPDAALSGQIRTETRVADYELTIKTLPMAPPDEAWRFIARMELTIGGDEVSIPREACQLIRVHRVSPIFRTGETHRFIIWGGDGEDSYTVHFVIQDGRLVRREFYKRLLRIPHVMEF